MQSNEAANSKRHGTVGIVAIGRNEGERLRPCLKSATQASDRVVYVDSGSKDSSVDLAREFAIDVIELDSTTPFTAARGRNAGFAHVLARWPDTRFVHFVDGDCELDPDWIGVAFTELASGSSIAAVCGRRRERYPGRTIFNRLCDIEWEGLPGLVESCGGDALMRVEPVIAVNGFAEELIAGEDDDICYRMRQCGWKIIRLPNEMTLHDVAMTSVLQWWQRNRRTGHAGAEAWQRRGKDNPRLMKILLSNLLWGLPVFWPFWPILWWRVYRRSDFLYATHIVLGKVPHCMGQLSFWWTRARAREARLIEYK